MIWMVINKTTGQQVGRLHATAGEARAKWPETYLYDVVSVDQVCMATDWCAAAANTVVEGPGRQEAVAHHVQVCGKHRDPTTWGAE